MTTGSRPARCAPCWPGCARPSPDVLLVDHTRVELARRAPRAAGPRAAARDPGPGLRHAWPTSAGLLSLFTVAWNKVLRRDFLLATAALRHRLVRGPAVHLSRAGRWPTGSPPSAGSATTTASGAQDGITQTRSDRHFEVFDQWSPRVRSGSTRSARGPTRSGADIFERMVLAPAGRTGTPTTGCRPGSRRRRTSTSCRSTTTGVHRPAGRTVRPGGLTGCAGA